MFLTYKIDLMQRLQQACALFLHDSVTNPQMPIPHSCLPPLAGPANTSYHKRMKMTTMNYLFKFWQTSIQFI
jgi:hypothetical protein